MKKLFVLLTLLIMTITTFAKNTNTEGIEENSTEKNNWVAKMKDSNFHLGLDLQTKYMWRGMEMMPDESAPVLFPGINYQSNGWYVYAMGGYAINGKYAEVDLGISYSWKGMTLAFNDYYYPAISGKDDEYFGGKHNGHWLEAVVT